MIGGFNPEKPSPRDNGFLPFRFCSVHSCGSDSCGYPKRIIGQSCGAGCLSSGRPWLGSWLVNPGTVSAGRRGGGPLTLYERMWRGWMPEAETLSADLIPSFYSSYLQTYIERDARHFSAYHDAQSLGSFACLRTSMSALDILPSAMARELGVFSPTASGCIDTLFAKEKGRTRLICLPGRS
jgi:hypothetical protein